MNDATQAARSDWRTQATTHATRQMFAQDTPSHIAMATGHIHERAAEIAAQDPGLPQKYAYASAVREWAGALFTMEGGDSPDTQITWVLDTIAQLNTEGFDVRA